jgi:hypothetical protein
MRLHRTLLATLLTLASLAALGPAPAAAGPAAGGSASVEVFATGLVYRAGWSSTPAAGCTWPRPARAARW